MKFFITLVYNRFPVILLTIKQTHATKNSISLAMVGLDNSSTNDEAFAVLMHYEKLTVHNAKRPQLHVSVNTINRNKLNCTINVSCIVNYWVKSFYAWS